MAVAGAVKGAVARAFVEAPVGFETCIFRFLYGESSVDRFVDFSSCTSTVPYAYFIDVSVEIMFSVPFAVATQLQNRVGKVLG